MRELPPAKEEEQHNGGIRFIKSVGVSPKGYELPPTGILREICG
jgi:hypothetical protein